MESVTKAIELIKWLDSQIDGLPIQTDERTRIAAACFDTALEHQKAIVLLVSNSLKGSALALVRLIFESYIRGVWLLRCASKEQIGQFKNGKLKRTFAELIGEIEAIESYGVEVLSKSQKAGWSLMNEFTHTGYAQVVRRNTSNTIEPNYDPAEVNSAVEFACSIALLSAIEISFLARNEELSLKLLDRVKEFGGRQP